MAERKTRLIVEAEGKGLDKLRRGLDSTTGSLQNVGKAATGLEAMGDNLKRNVKEMDAATKAAQRQERATRKLTDETERGNRIRERESRKPMRGGNGRFISGSQDFTPEQRQQVRQRQNMRGFAMGVMQGSGMGEYFPAQGLSANVAGRALGGGARRVGQGAQSAMFGGVGGMAQALSGIPVVGGALAGQLNNLTQTAGAGLNAYTQESQLLSNVDLSAFAKAKGANTRRALGGVASKKQSALSAGMLSSHVYNQTMRNTTSRQAIQALPGGDEAALSYAMEAAANPWSGVGGGTLLENQGAVAAGKRTLATSAADEAHKGQLAKGRAARGGARRNADSKTRKDFLNLSQFSKQGVGLGMSNADIRSFMGQMSNAEGGSLGNLTGDPGGTSLAMAMSKLGIDAQTTGTIAKGSRLSGQSTESTLMKVMSQGMRLNLAGSDLLKYVKDTAGSLSDIENTGIPFSVDGFGQSSRELASSFGMERGVSMAKGFRQSGRRLSQQGPSSGIDMLAMQTMYGYDPAGGQKSFYAAKQRAEESRPMAGGTKAFMQRTMQGNNLTAEGKAERLIQGLQGQGVSIGRKEALQIATKGFDGFEKDIGGEMQLDMKSLAASKTSRGEKTKASNANLTEAAGKRILGTVQTLEAAQAKMAVEWSKQSTALQGMAKAVSDAAVGVTKNAQEFITDLQSLLHMEVQKRETEAAKR